MSVRPDSKKTVDALPAGSSLSEPAAYISQYYILEFEMKTNRVCEKLSKLNHHTVIS